MRRVDFHLAHQVSPYTVYRRLAAGDELLLVDLGGGAPRPPALAGARERPGPRWRPPSGVDVVLFDDDGREALDLARRLHAEGHRRVRALFGGLELWDLALGDLEEQKDGDCRAAPTVL